MIHPENSRPNMDHLADPMEHMDRLEGRFRAGERIAGILGITLAYALYDSDDPIPQFSRKESQPVFGASIGKLGLANMILDLDLDPVKLLDISPGRVDTTGGGKYDEPITEPISVTIGDLLSDMIGPRSGNTAVRVFAPVLGGADDINAYYRERGFVHTNVQKGIVRDVGGNVRDDIISINLDKTSPSDATLMLGDIMARPASDSPLVGIAQDALWTSETNDHGARIAKKTGDYPGDDDDPFIFRHNVGIAVGKRGMLRYAIFSTSPMARPGEHDLLARVRGVLAAQGVSRLAAEVASTAAGKPVFALGHVARRFSL